MTFDDSVKTARDGVALVGEVLRAAGDNPKVKEAGQNLGEAALTLTKTIKNALLPLVAVNFACDKARTYFSEKFQQDISEKTSSIPSDQIVEPKAYVAGPALQGLAFTHDEPNLKEMYLNLLATAMDGRSADDAHPAFVEVIRQINSEEARLLQDALKSSGTPIVEVRLSTVGESGYRTLLRHVLNLTKGTADTPVEDPRLPAMVDNWVRLGLVNVDYSLQLTNGSAYDWVEQRPELVRLRETREDEQHKVEIGRGVLNRTAFGIQFARAISLA